MASLQKRLQEDLKEALRKDDVARKSTIRYVLSDIHNLQIARQSIPDDDSVIELLSKQVKQRRDSIDAFVAGDRQDLVDKEQIELAIVLEYLPEQMPDEELMAMARNSIEEVMATGPQDMGKVMGHLMPKVKGKAEGRTVSATVLELLNDLSH